MKMVLLYSGGMDSYAINFIEKPDVRLYFMTGGRYEQAEIHYIHQSSIQTTIDTVFRGLGSIERSDYIIPYRNAFFLLGAARHGQNLMLGATAGDRVLDKSEAFGELMENMINFLNKDWWNPDAQPVRILMPYKKFTKRRLVATYAQKGGDLEKLDRESYSCYSGDWTPCGRCKPCFRKWVALRLNDYRQKNTETVREYIEREILPQIQAGTYGRKQEEVDILEAMNV